MIPKGAGWLPVVIGVQDAQLHDCVSEFEFDSTPNSEFLKGIASAYRAREGTAVRNSVANPPLEAGCSKKKAECTVSFNAASE